MRYILDLLTVLTVSVILNVLFKQIDSILFNDFFAGWLSCMLWYYLRRKHK